MPVLRRSTVPDKLEKQHVIGRFLKYLLGGGGPLNLLELYSSLITVDPCNQPVKKESKRESIG